MGETPITESMKSAGSLPPTVVRDVRRAGRMYERLQAAGREVRFTPGEGGLRIELCDAEGNVVRRLSAADAIGIATAPV